MLFNSFQFIFALLPIAFFVYFFLLQKRLVVGAKAFLVFVSLFFYSWWNVSYLPIILSSMLFNYAVGNSLNGNFTKIRIHKKSLIFIGVTANLALLGYFKYTDFFLENYNLAFDKSIPLTHLALPLAISFFTFQQIAYLVDSSRGETTEYDFLNYSLFVTFFPQLIAGPIVHHAEMMPQFASRWNLVKNYKNITSGLFIFSIGLFKKVVIADTFAVWATSGFDVAEKLNLIAAWITSLSYAFQLYFDFSGYTDMAVGAALLFNIKLPVNFNSPYKATSIQDFWRRWHMTLSRFLKDYVYIPLGGNRKGEFRIYTNLLTTFLLGGIWHGAGWTFLLWGALHGLALAIHRYWHELGYKMNTILAWFITFNFVNFSWVFFRAKEWDDAIKVLKGMAGMTGLNLPAALSSKLAFLGQYGVEFGNLFSVIEGDLYTPVWILAGFALVLLFKNSIEQIHSFKISYKTVCFSGLLFVYGVLSMNRISEFLYFDF